MPQSVGFTMIELIIVVSIMAILTAKLVNYYSNQITDQRRTDGQVVLTATAAALKQCKLRYGGYDHAACAGVIPEVSPDGYYTLESANNTATTFALIALGSGSQANDNECGNLSLTHDGIKGVSGTLMPADCW